MQFQPVNPYFTLTNIWLHPDQYTYMLSRTGVEVGPLCNKGCDGRDLIKLQNGAHASSACNVYHKKLRKHNMFTKTSLITNKFKKYILPVHSLDDDDKVLRPLLCTW